MTCNHTTDRWEAGSPDYETGYPGPDEWVEHSTFEDIDLHRMRCTRCGEIKYYSGAARAFWEDGKRSDIPGIGG